MKKNLIVLKIASKISDFISAQDNNDNFALPASVHESSHSQNVQSIPGATTIQAPNPSYILPSPEENPKQYLNELNKYISYAKKDKSTVFELPLELLYFHTKPENRQTLEKLLKSNINFYFKSENQETISQEETDTILRYFTLGQKKETPRKKGSPDVIWGNPELNSQANTEWSSRKKTQKALFDIDNIYARQQIVKYKHQGLSANKIAALLNEQEFQTSRGSSFQAKQITRHLETYKDILELFKPKINETEFLHPVQSSGKLEFPFGRIELPQEKDFIIIYFSKPHQADFTISITDNQERPTFNHHYHPAETKEGTMDMVIIDILKDTTIYPGCNYICISSEGYKDIRDIIIVRPDLRIEEKM